MGCELGKTMSGAWRSGAGRFRGPSATNWPGARAFSLGPSSREPANEISTRATHAALSNLCCDRRAVGRHVELTP
jgi:hypothetical protein